MLKKLKNLKEDRTTNKTSSSIRERFKFLKEKHRPTYQKNLRTWNKRLDRVIDSAYEASNKHKTVLLDHKAKEPSSRLRILSKRLFSALWRRWSCDCETPHEARFCIDTCGSNGNNDLSKMNLTFNFVISHHRSRWYEGVVVMETTKYALVRLSGGPRTWVISMTLTMS